MSKFVFVAVWIIISIASLSKCLELKCQCSAPLHSRDTFENDSSFFSCRRLFEVDSDEVMCKGSAKRSCTQTSSTHLQLADKMDSAE